MLNKLVELILNNGWFASVGFICLLDAALVVAGLAGKTPWTSLLVKEVPAAPTEPATRTLTKLGIAHVVAWTIVPPAWFFLESFTIAEHLLPSIEHANANLKVKWEYERLRLAQELGSKVWAAVLAAILFLAPKK